MAHKRNSSVERARGSTGLSSAPPDSSLRQRAEAWAGLMGIHDLGSLPPGEAGRLLHELQGHQIEVEMQNDELRRVQAALEASQARYFDLYDLAPVGYVSLTEKGVILETNLRAATLLGVPRSALVGRPLSQSIIRADQDTFYRHCQQLLRMGESEVCEVRMARRDATRFWARLESTVVEDAEGSEAVCRVVLSDITESKRAEEARREQQVSEAMLTAARAVLKSESFERAAGAVFEACAGCVGATAGYAIVRSEEGVENRISFAQPGDIATSQDRPLSMAMRGLHAQACIQGEVIWQNDLTTSLSAALRPGGQVALDNVLVAPLCLGGANLGLLALTNKPSGFGERDAQIAKPFGELAAIAIERSRARERLEASERRFSTIFDRVSDGVLLIEPKTRGFVMSNRAVRELLGYTEVELLGLTVANICPEETLPVVLDAFEQQARGEPKLAFEVPVRRADGKVLYVEVSTAPLTLDGRSLVMATFRDVTERRALQADVAQADRLANVGLMAAGVAHEINNPLLFVLYNLESLAEDLPRLTSAVRRCADALVERSGDTPLAELVGKGAELLEPAALADLVSRTREALLGGRRINEIARGLSTFARVERVDLSLVNINQAAERAISMAGNQIRYRARLVKDLSPVPAILASDGRLAQVFLNLLVNAAHAIDEGATEKQCVTVRSWVEGREVLADVGDTGHGIPTENLELVFDPFFTTKTQERGTGLGLSITRRIVESFGGEITVTSEVGVGTHFLMRFPIPEARLKLGPAAMPESAPRAGSELAVLGPGTDEAPAERPQAPAVREQPGTPAAPARILVVDDEELICVSLKRVLGSDHEVVTATSGEEARAILKQDPAFELILCDVMMPGMSGMDLHAWLVEANPALARQVVFLTGGVFTPRAASYLGAVTNLRVEKPFSPLNLLDLVSEQLTRSRTAIGEFCQNRSG